MAGKEVPRFPTKKPPMWERDRPGCLKIILLVLLLLLLAGQMAKGEYANIAERDGLTWFTLFVKLVLLALLIVLIRVQRDLKCELTNPKGCTAEEPDPVEGRLFVRVEGTASGGAFGSYTLEVWDGAAQKTGVVTYPGGGASGGTPVIAGELGQINTTSLLDGGYEVRLIVHPAWGGAPKTCSTTFNLLKTTVYINRVAGVQTVSMSPVPDNPNPYDPAAELRTSAGPVAVGGRHITIRGAAYVYECPGRKIRKYEIRYAKVAAPGPEPLQPVTGGPIPPIRFSRIKQQ